jgi:hypothetical protein
MTSCSEWELPGRDEAKLNRVLVSTARLVQPAEISMAYVGQLPSSGVRSQAYRDVCPEANS